MTDKYFTTVIDFGSGFVRAALADDCSVGTFNPIKYRNIYGVPKYGSIIESYSNYVNSWSQESQDSNPNDYDNRYSISYPSKNLNKQTKNDFDEHYIGPAASENRFILKLYNIFNNYGQITKIHAAEASIITAMRLIYEKSKENNGVCADIKNFEEFARSTRIIMTVSSFRFRYDFNSGYLSNIRKFLFSELHVLSVLFIPSGILTFYTAIAQTMSPGIVLTIGDTETSAIPVMGVSNNCAVGKPTEMRCSHIGGRNIVRSFASLLSEHGTLMLQSPLNLLENGVNSELEIIREIMEKICAVIPNPQVGKWLHELSEKRNMNSDTALQTVGGIYVDEKCLAEVKNRGLEIWECCLPDGTEIEIGKNYEHLLAPEVLFRPQDAGIEEPSIIELLKEVFYSADVAVRKMLLKNIIIAGGCANIRKIEERIKNELYKELSQQIKLDKSDIIIKKYEGCESSACLGGCAIAKINAFNGLFITDNNDGEGISTRF